MTAKYSNVKNARIVPETYLRNWAIDEKIGTWLLPEGTRLADQPVGNVGTRQRFYRRERPRSGEVIDDVEAMLGDGEAKAIPLPRTFDQRSPLSSDEKMQLAELFSYQLLRGPRWKAEYEKWSREFLDELPTLAFRNGGSGVAKNVWGQVWWRDFAENMATAMLLGQTLAAGDPTGLRLSDLAQIEDWPSGVGGYVKYRLAARPRLNSWFQDGSIH